MRCGDYGLGLYAGGMPGGMGGMGGGMGGGRGGGGGQRRGGGGVSTPFV